MQSWIEKFVVGVLLKQLTPEVLKQAEEAVKTFLVVELTKLAAETPTDIDDKVMERVAALLGVVVPKIAAA